MGQKLSSNTPQSSKPKQPSGLNIHSPSRRSSKVPELVHAKFSWKDPNRDNQYVSLVASFNSWDPIPLKYHEPTREWLVILTIPAGTHLYRYIVSGEYRYDTKRKYIVDKDGKCSNLVTFHASPNSPESPVSGRSRPISVLQQNPQYRAMMESEEEYVQNGSRVGTRHRSRSGPPRPRMSGTDPKASGEIPVRYGRHKSPLQKSKSHEKLRPSDPENPENNVYGQEEYVFPVKRKYPPLLPPHTSYTLLNIRPDDPLTPTKPSISAKRTLEFNRVRWDDVEPLHVTLNHIYFARSKETDPDDGELIEMGVSTRYRGKSTTIHILSRKKRVEEIEMHVSA